MADDEGSWWDPIRKIVSGVPSIPDPKAEAAAKPPAFNTQRWLDFSEKAGYGKDSAEYALIKGIGDNANEVPRPDLPSRGTMMLQSLLGAASAGFFRRAGADPMAAAAPNLAIAQDWRDLRDKDLAARTSAWKEGGDKTIATATNMAQQAAALRRAQAIADQNAAIMGYPKQVAGPKGMEGAPGEAAPAAPQIYPGSKNQSAIPPAGPATSQSPIPPGGPIGANQSPIPAGGPAAASQASPASPPGGSPASSPGAADQVPTNIDGVPMRYRAGNNHFVTREAAEFFERNFAAVNYAEAMGGVATLKDDKGNVTAASGIRTTTDLMKAAREMDDKLYQSSLSHKGKEAGQSKQIEWSSKTFEDLSGKAEAASKSNYSLEQFKAALMERIAKGGTTGPVTEWKQLAQKYLTDAGLGHWDVSDGEAMKKSALSLAGEMVKSAVGNRTTQMEFKTFIDAVLSTGLSTEGNLRMLPFFELRNNADMEIQRLAAERMQQNGGQLPYTFQQEANAINEKYALQAVEQGKAILADFKAGKLSPKHPEELAAAQPKPTPAPAGAPGAGMDEQSAARLVPLVQKHMATGMSMPDAAAAAKEELAAQGMQNKLNNVGSPGSFARGSWRHPRVNSVDPRVERAEAMARIGSLIHEGTIKKPGEGAYPDY